MKLLLVRTGNWNDAAAEYIQSLVARCGVCSLTSHPKPSRKVSLSSLNLKFNDTVCVDHVFLHDFRMFHVMHSATRYCAGHLSADLSLTAVVATLKTI